MHAGNIDFKKTEPPPHISALPRGQSRTFVRGGLLLRRQALEKPSILGKEKKKRGQPVSFLIRRVGPFLGIEPAQPFGTRAGVAFLDQKWRSPAGLKLVHPSWT